MSSPGQLYTRTAELSEDEKYRFSLTRGWRRPPDCIGGSVLFIGHNPSTADARTDDPTIHMMVNIAHNLGYGRISVANLLPIRTSSPFEAHKWFFEEWPIGDWMNGRGPAAALTRNASSIIDLVDDAAKCVACWGAIAQPVKNLADDMVDFFKRRGVDLYVLGLTKEGWPTHPSARGSHRISAETKPVIWKSP